MSKPYSALRAEMLAQDIDQAYLCELTGKSQGYLTARMTGRRPWESDVMYLLMDELHLPHDQLHRYFPPNGREATVKAARITTVHTARRYRVAR